MSGANCRGRSTTKVWTVRLSGTLPGFPGNKRGVIVVIVGVKENRGRKFIKMIIGDIIVHEGQNVRIEDISEYGYYVTPLTYNRNGIVRAGRSFWISG
jgi:hypothetical protein